MEHVANACFCAKSLNMDKFHAFIQMRFNRDLKTFLKKGYDPKCLGIIGFECGFPA